jgi:hypothetical protein
VRLFPFRANVTQAASAPSLFKRFLLVAASSWVVGPLGAIFLHSVGWGDEPHVIAVLLAITAGGPLQIMLNEFVATGVAAERFSVSVAQYASIFGLVLITVLLALLNSKDDVLTGTAPALLWLISALTAASLLLSCILSARLYRCLMRGHTDTLAIITIGAVPGFTVLLSFFAAVAVNIPELALLAAIAPAICQLICTWRFIPLAAPSAIVGQPQAVLRTSVVLGVSAFLAAIGWAITSARADLLLFFPGYGVITLACLNVLGATILIASRSRYVTSGEAKVLQPLAISVALIIGGFALENFYGPASLVLIITGLQFAVAAGVALARNLGAGRVQSLSQGVEGVQGSAEGPFR